MIQNFNIYTNSKKTEDKHPDYKLVAKLDDKALYFGVAWKKKSDSGSYLSVALDKPREYQKDGQTVKLDGYVIITESEYKKLLNNQKAKIGTTDIDYPENDLDVNPFEF